MDALGISHSTSSGLYNWPSISESDEFNEDVDEVRLVLVDQNNTNPSVENGVEENEDGVADNEGVEENGDPPKNDPNPLYLLEEAITLSSSDDDEEVG